MRICGSVIEASQLRDFVSRRSGNATYLVNVLPHEAAVPFSLSAADKDMMDGATIGPLYNRADCVVEKQI